jgi:two-component system, sensor histidine kinase YesM
VDAKNRGRKYYLSWRIFALAVLTAFLLVFLLGALLRQYLAGRGSLWPVLVGAGAAAGIIVLLVQRILRPYWQIEKNIKLFLEGYTSSESLVVDDAELTPAGEEMKKRLYQIMNSSELLKLNKRQAQYLALQNQINPHFLYNTLESIRSEALISGLDSVADMTEALATFFRYTISKVENLVSVEEELQNCQTYFKIQRYRFGERLHLSIEYDPEEKDELFCCRIPKLTMQPILENSIIHGTECKVDGGHLRIVLEKSGGRLLIRISDDGVGMSPQKLADMNERLQKSASAYSTGESEAKGGIALVNVNNRIHLLFGEEYGMHVFSMKDVGTDVEITLPVITSDREITGKVAAG